MKVAVLGYGVVGKGVYDMLRTCPLLEAGSVLVRPGKVDELSRWTISKLS